MVKWDIQHTLVMIATTLVGATMGYIEQQSATSLMEALQSKAALGHMLMVMAVVDLSALAALAKQSFLMPPANSGGAGDQANKSANPSSFPKKPAAMRGALIAFVTAAFLSFVYLTTGSLITGCNGLNIVSIVTQLSTYVTAFIQVAQTIWATILPLLGNNSATANVAFQDAVVSLQNANALMMDGEQAYEAGKTVNLPQLMQAVQDAVARVMNVINQFKGQMPAHAYATTDTLQTLDRMATSINHWQVP